MKQSGLARKVRQFSRRLQARIEQYVDGDITFDELTASARGWIAHVEPADPAGGCGATCSGGIPSRRENILPKMCLIELRAT